MIIVVSPLNLLMQEQVEKLSETVNAIVLQVNDNKEMDANCKIVFLHPEVFVCGYFHSLVAALKWRVKLLSLTKPILLWNGK
jgi:superfamily II DNA helicase RecQ